MIFPNKRYFTRQHFTLLNSSLKIYKKGLLDEIEYEIPFDNIHHKKTIQTEINNNLFFAGVFFVVLSLLLLFGTAEELAIILFVFGALFIAIAFINRKKLISIPTYTGEPIQLFFSNANKEEVINFANQLINATNKYLLKKYGKIDRTLPREPQIEHLQFLVNREIISEEEFENLKNQLMGMEGKSTIGFS